MAFGATARQTRDEDSERIAQVVGGFEKLKSENSSLRDRLSDADRALSLKDGEMSILIKALDHERRMRTFYQTFAVRVSMRLSTIMDEACTALREAEEAANVESEMNQGNGADIPPIEIPPFMKRWQAEHQEQA